MRNRQTCILREHMFCYFSVLMTEFNELCLASLLFADAVPNRVLIVDDAYNVMLLKLWHSLHEGMQQESLRKESQRREIN